MMRFRLFKNKYRNSEIAPDEIFLDSHNMPAFDTQQFEGRIEKPIAKQAGVGLGLFFAVIGVIFIGQLSSLQIAKGDTYADASKNNALDRNPIFADRGIIYDRNEVELAWNTEADVNDPASFPHRSYIETPGFAHILGYVSYPSKDASGRYWQKEYIGKDSVEKVYNTRLAGENGIKIIETDALGAIVGENLVNPPKHGENLHLSIDSRIQTKMHAAMVEMSKTAGFTGGAGVMMNVQNGEVIALTNFPEYDSNILSRGEDRKIINQYLTDKTKPFMNRVVSGLYTPGSIVKPFVALGALTEGVISPSKQIYSSGQLVVPNPYTPSQPSIFKDNKAHGYVDIRHALAVSSNVYFYQVGGGFQDQKGIGILNIKKYSELFGIGKKTGIDLPAEVEGIIPDPTWKEKVFKGEQWRIGDTYNTSIGQYGYQVTPIQMVRAIAGIANFGRLPTPHVLKGDLDKEKETTIVDLSYEHMKIVQEGMRLMVTEGTGQRLNLPFVSVAAKSGTAQVGLSKNKMNAWIVGFFPYEAPKYAFAVMMENGPSTNQMGASYVMGELLRYMETETPEYFQ